MFTRLQSILVASYFVPLIILCFHLYSAPLSDEKAQKIIDQALNSSSLDMRNVVAVITGLMGSGKTWLLSRLFNQLPPDLYTSTGVAERSLHSLLHHIINLSSSCWEPFNYEQTLEFLAGLFHGSIPDSDVALADKALYALPTTTTQASLAPLSSSSSMETTSPPSLQASSTTFPSSSSTAQSSTMQSMVRKVQAPKSSSSQEILELVHMIDTGGQPEMLENLPSLIHHCHLIVLVLNLMFGLDEHPSIDYHEKGKAYKRALPYQYSNRQIIQKLASTLQAKRFSQKEEQCFQLLVVATHRDCVPKGELHARVKSFDMALRAMLLPASEEQLICFRFSQIPFVLNLKNPDRDDEKRLNLIRSMVSASEVGKIVKIPGSFLVFEQELMEFAGKNVKRDILSLSECQQLGERLKMTHEEIEAALIFLHRQFTILYFRHILPTLVFTRPQTPLECINAVVQFSYKVESGEVMCIKEKLASSLRDGIITEEILSHEQLTQCFIPGLYEPCDAIDLLCHTLTLAPLSREVQSTPDSSHPATSTPPPPIKREKREYLMMCLQKPIPDKDLPKHLPPPSEIAPLVVQFTKNCVPLSCFSRTISCLLAMYDWKLSRGDKGSPQCLAHNVVSLYTPQTPGQVVLSDMGHSLQVHIKTNGGIKPKSFPGICFHVKETVLAAIKHVFELLNLAGIEASSAFVCPCLGVPHSHTASAYLFQSQWLLRCSVTGNSAGAAENKHQVWLEAPVVEKGKPSLSKLLGLDIPLKVGAKYFQFGVLLLNDEDGALVEALEDECNGKRERIVRKILVEWVRGRGRALSWKTLSDTLRECSLSSLADDIDSTYT